MLSQHIPLCVGRSLGKVDIGVCVSEPLPVVVVPGGVGTHVYTALHRLSWKTSSVATSCTRKRDSCYDSD